jgi:DNA-binding response OmpR family regulator
MRKSPHFEPRRWCSSLPGQPRALVVEDDGAVGDLIALTLREIGFGVDRSESAEHGLMRVQSGERYDLVVSGVEIPGFGGTAFRETARRVWSGIDGALVLIAESEDPKHVSRLLAPCFSKPLDLRFYAHVRGVFERSRHRAAAAASR